MNSVAVSLLPPDEDADFAPSSVVSEVAAMARRNLAPLAPAIDEGTVYPSELLRRLGDVGAWESHRPKNGAADLRCDGDDVICRIRMSCDGRQGQLQAERPPVRQLVQTG